MRRGEGQQHIGLPPLAMLYIAGIWALAFGVGQVWKWPATVAMIRHESTSQWSLLVLCGLSVWSWWVRERDIGGKVSLSLTSIVLLASIVLVGIPGAAIVGVVAPLAALGSERLTFTALNCAMFSSIGSLGAWAYAHTGGPTLAHFEKNDPGTLSRMIMALLVADIVQCLANAFIVSGMYRVHRGRPFQRQFLGILRSTGLVYVGYGLIGIIFVIIWVRASVGPFTAVLVLAPLLVAQWSFAQYGDERRSHERTLSALVTALETKNRYTRGHSERVAELCDLAALHLTLTAQESEALRYAGLLHDIGKLGLPTRLLRRPAPLTDPEIVAIGTHGELGAQMLQGITFLSGALEGIRHHHERWDGKGYPDQLSGLAIPQFARIIAVADAFDTMMTDRGDRAAYAMPAALAELRHRAGTQFDPAVVTALEEGLAKRTWDTIDLSSSLQWVGAAPYDHDCPVTSDELAVRSELLRQIREAVQDRSKVS